MPDGLLMHISLGIPRELKFRRNQYMTNQDSRFSSGIVTPSVSALGNG